MTSPSTTAAAAGLDPEKTTQDTWHLPLWRKCIILFVVSWMTFVVTFSSTSLLPATPEIAADLHTTPELLNVTNAGVLLAMGFSSLIWGPVTALLGRRVAYNIAIGALCGCSVGTAVAGGSSVFTAFRVLGGLTGTSFMVQGQTILADIFEAVCIILLVVGDRADLKDRKLEARRLGSLWLGR
jgi:MFS family permease